jgi:hypothetical protein
MKTMTKMVILLMPFMTRRITQPPFHNSNSSTNPPKDSLSLLRVLRRYTSSRGRRLNMCSHNSVLRLCSNSKRNLPDQRKLARNYPLLENTIQTLQVVAKVMMIVIDELDM